MEVPRPLRTSRLWGVWATVMLDLAQVAASIENGTFFSSQPGGLKLMITKIGTHSDLSQGSSDVTVQSQE